MTTVQPRNQGLSFLVGDPNPSIPKETVPVASADTIVTHEVAASGDVSSVDLGTSSGVMKPTAPPLKYAVVLAAAPSVGNKCVDILTA